MEHLIQMDILMFSRWDASKGIGLRVVTVMLPSDISQES